MKCVQQLPKWGCGCNTFVHGVRVEGFQGVEVSQPFQSYEMSVRGFQMALVCQKVVPSREIPCKMELWLRNWKFLRFGILQPFRSCEMRVTVLQNGTRVPKSGFAAVKSFAKWSFPCENGIFHALVVRSRFAAAKIFTERGLRLRTGFAAKCRFRRPLFLPCFCSVFSLFDSERLPFNFFAFPLDFDHPKTYITSKQSELKH